MLFIIEGDSGNPNHGTFRAEKKTKKDAYDTAVSLVQQGVIGVTIISEDGHRYTTSEFGKMLSEES